MKYSDKTAIAVNCEIDRKYLISFFISIKNDCNVTPNWRIEDIKLGEIWRINECGNLMNLRLIREELPSSYTLIQGVPEDWIKEKESEPTLPVGIEMYSQILENIVESQKATIN